MTVLPAKWKGTIGADPEMFVFTGKKLLPAYKFLPSKLESSRPLLYWDGFQAEWKYEFGVRCLVHFTQETQLKIRALFHKAKAYDKTAKLSIRNVVSVPKVLLQRAPEQYVALGCEPSYNAYKIDAERVDNPRELKIRVAGGHIHFGGWYMKPNYEKHVKALDAILGVWSVGAAQDIDIPLRRKYYGMAGEFRTPHYKRSNTYGIEYRTLSNFWLCHPRIFQLTLEIARAALVFGTMKNSPWVATEEEVVKTINDCDVDQAKAILKRNKTAFTQMLAKLTMFSPMSREKAFQVGQKGVEHVVDPEDVAENWNLTASRLWDYYDVPCWNRVNL